MINRHIIGFSVVMFATLSVNASGQNHDTSLPDRSLANQSQVQVDRLGFNWSAGNLQHGNGLGLLPGEGVTGGKNQVVKELDSEHENASFSATATSATATHFSAAPFSNNGLMVDSVDQPSQVALESVNKPFQNGILSAFYLPHDHKNTGFLDFNTYWDTRDLSVFTINAGAKLPYDFEYFQFINFTSPLGDSSELEDWNDFFTEIHLRRPIAKENPWLKHVDWNLMWADGGFPNEVGRFGIRWRWQDTPGSVGRFFTDFLKLQYTTTFHILEDDGSGWQIEHVYRRNFFDGLIYIGGFADHNINSPFGDSDWVAECQIGLKLYGNCFAVAEHRYNSFLPAQFRSGFGLGIEYSVPLR